MVVSRCLHLQKKKRYCLKSVVNAVSVRVNHKISLADITKCKYIIYQYTFDCVIKEVLLFTIRHTDTNSRFGQNVIGFSIWTYHQQPGTWADDWMTADDDNLANDDNLVN